MTPMPLRSAPSRRYAHLALLLLLAINLLNYIDRYVLAAVLPRIGSEMLAGDPNAYQKQGWLATAFLISYMLTSPLFGWLADRLSRWLLVGIGVIVWSLASGGSGLATTYVALLVTRMFVGIGEAAYGPTAPTIISDLYPLERRGRMMAWFYMAIPVGSAMGYALGGIAANWNWRWGFYAVVPFGLILGVMSWLMPDPPRGASDVVSPSAPAPLARKARLRDYLQLLRIRSYVLNCLGMASLTFAIGGMSYWMPDYIYKFRHAGSLRSVNLIFGAITVVTGISATLLGGMAGDWLRSRVRGAYFVVSAGGLLLAFPFFVLVLLVPFPLAWVFIFLAEFWLFFNTGPSNTALANVTHPSIRATAFAINILFIHALGDAISPPLIGVLSDQFGGNMNVGFGLVGLVILLGAGFWLWGARYLDADTAKVPQPSPGGPGDGA
jgi:MFS family permease